eukprot:750937-Hanusia_phi.AAC.8
MADPRRATSPRKGRQPRELLTSTSSCTITCKLTAGLLLVNIQNADKKEGEEQEQEQEQEEVLARAGWQYFDILEEDVATETVLAVEHPGQLCDE